MNMTELIENEDVFSEYGDNPEENFNEIRKNLLEDFETAKTVGKVARGESKLSGICGKREPVKVYLRVRPFTNKEIDAGESQGCLAMESRTSVLMHPPKTSFTFKHQARNPITAETVHRFSFSRVFGPETSQKAFFEDTSLSVVKDFIDGQNCLMFSYGITNSGKTYTILGNAQCLGILPRTINILFNSFKDKNYKRANLKPKMFCDVVKLSSIQEEREESKKKMLLSLSDVPTYHNSVSSTDSLLQDISHEKSCQEDSVNISSASELDVTSVDVDIQGPVQFSVWLSFAEIYNEQIYDLLEPISLGKERRRTMLKVGDDRKGNPYIKGLTEIHVTNVEEAMKLLKIGRKNQKIASTKLNENSSRSHCIFTLKILRVVDGKEPHVARVSRLSFVDLAGSERYTKTRNTGERLKESGNINTSIMTLGKCVELLRYNQNHINNPKNIPFRESKLTRLFQGLFCGKGKASMIVNVNQCASAFDETLYALKFAAIAKRVTTLVQEPVQEGHVPRSTRSSVAWADGSLSTPAGDKVHVELADSRPAPLVEEEKSDIQENTNEELRTLISVLQEQLIEEKKNMALLEVKIREEVCQEMAEQMVEIENNFNERLLEDQRMNEDLYEKRMDLLTKSVKKSRKRPRVDRVEDDEDEWVSSVLLHKEQVKVKNMDEKIADLEHQIKAMKEDQSMEVGSLQEELCERDERIKSLERSVKDYKVELEAKTSQLTAAKKIQGGRSATPTKTAANSNLIKQLEKRLEETTAALDKKNSQLINKNNVIARLENSLKDSREDLKEQEKELVELKVQNKMLASDEKNEKDNEEEVDRLNSQLKEKESALVTKAKENEEVVENLKFVEGELQILTVKDRENQNELVKLKHDHEELNDEVTKWKKETEKYKQLKLNLEGQLVEKESAFKDSERKVQDLKRETESKESELHRCEVKMKSLDEIIVGLNKQITEAHSANESLQEKYDESLVCLANVQATVQVRDQKLEQYETLDKSLKDAYRDKESEIIEIKRELTSARSELHDKENDLGQVKKEMEKRMEEEILKVNQNWENVIQRMKTGLEEQEEVLAQMEKDIVTKESEITEYRLKIEELIKTIADINEKVEKLSEENEHLDHQKEKLKIKVFELETEVQKLQQDVKKESSKKDTATQALRDGLEIVKTKKVEYERKMNAIMTEMEEMKSVYEEKVKELEGEIERLKSVNSETGEKTTSTSKKESNSDTDNVYKPVEVESFSLPAKDRLEIDVTPITGSGLLKGGKKTAGTKTKVLKRKSSDLTLQEIKDQINSKAKTANNEYTEDDFTPASVTKLRKTRSSSVSAHSRQSKANIVPSPSFSLFTLGENSENTNPRGARTSRDSPKSASSGKRKFFNKLGIPENTKNKTEKRRRKLLKKENISAPFTDSPFCQSDKLETPTPASRAQELITRHLRSRTVKTTR